MRRFLAISLLFLFGLPLISPVFALANSEASVPACCRRSGKHHCMMRMEQQPSSATQAVTNVAVIGEKCPCPPQALPCTSNFHFTLNTGMAVFAEIVAHPASVPQTEAKHRISFSRSRQKRGPPAPRA